MGFQKDLKEPVREDGLAVIDVVAVDIFCVYVELFECVKVLRCCANIKVCTTPHGTQPPIRKHPKHYADLKTPQERTTP